MALFPCGKGGRAGVAHGYKGKGVLINLFVDADGIPLSASSLRLFPCKPERQEGRVRT